MHNLAKFAIGAVLLAATGCGCLETITDGSPIRAGARPDPEQSPCNRCLFGTRYIPVLPTPSLQAEKTRNYSEAMKNEHTN